MFVVTFSRRGIAMAFLTVALPCLAVPYAAGGHESFDESSEKPASTKDTGTETAQGKLEFKSRKPDFEGTDIGEEASSRRYVAGHPLSAQRAVWKFETLPSRFPSPTADEIIAKLSCSTFALTNKAQNARKGEGVNVVVQAVTHRCPLKPPPSAEGDKRTGEWEWADNSKDSGGKLSRERYLSEVASYRAKMIDPKTAKPGTAGWKAANDLAEKYGYYEFSFTQPCVDATSLRLLFLHFQAPIMGMNPRNFRMPNRTVFRLGLNIEYGCTFDATLFKDIALPAGLIRNAVKNLPETDDKGKPKQPLVSIYVGCATEGLLLGVQESDLSLGLKTQSK